MPWPFVDCKLSPPAGHPYVTILKVDEGDSFRALFEKVRGKDVNAARPCSIGRALAEVNVVKEDMDDEIKAIDPEYPVMACAKDARLITFVLTACEGDLTGAAAPPAPVDADVGKGYGKGGGYGYGGKGGKGGMGMQPPHDDGHGGWNEMDYYAPYPPQPWDDGHYEWHGYPEWDMPHFPDGPYWRDPPHVDGPMPHHPPPHGKGYSGKGHSEQRGRGGAPPRDVQVPAMKAKKEPSQPQVIRMLPNVVNGAKAAESGQFSPIIKPSKQPKAASTPPKDSPGGNNRGTLLVERVGNKKGENNEKNEKDKAGEDAKSGGKATDGQGKAGADVSQGRVVAKQGGTKAAKENDTNTSAASQPSSRAADGKAKTKEEMRRKSRKDAASSSSNNNNNNNNNSTSGNDTRTSPREQARRDVSESPSLTTSDVSTAHNSPTSPTAKASRKDAADAGEDAVCAVCPTALGSDHPKYKTELCTRWEAAGTCSYAERCNFAHGKDELLDLAPELAAASAARATEHNFKTKLCRAWEAHGCCPRADTCTFAHGQEEMRTPTRPPNSKKEKKKKEKKEKENEDHEKKEEEGQERDGKRKTETETKKKEEKEEKEKEKEKQEGDGEENTAMSKMASECKEQEQIVAQ